MSLKLQICEQERPASGCLCERLKNDFRLHDTAVKTYSASTELESMQVANNTPSAIIFPLLIGESMLDLLSKIHVQLFVYAGGIDRERTGDV